MPVSQGELVRDMMDWFAGREDFPPPDERTVRWKVSAIWKELVLRDYRRLRRDAPLRNAAIVQDALYMYG